uniref:Uncharacterized protein n=1 Tax=Mus musculus TaxID=10090 RepID=Q3USB9_MOUSE|nr:unnamed protein product [Mus musculus]
MCMYDKYMSVACAHILCICVYLCVCVCMCALWSVFYKPLGFIHGSPFLITLIQPPLLSPSSQWPSVASTTSLGGSKQGTTARDK